MNHAPSKRINTPTVSPIHSTASTTSDINGRALTCATSAATITAITNAVETTVPLGLLTKITVVITVFLVTSTMDHQYHESSYLQ